MFAKSWKMVYCLSLVLAAGSASAQGTACGDSARAAFATAVANGATDQELEDQFGHCRTAFTEPVCKPDDDETTGALTSITGQAKSVIGQVKSIVNFNTFYERMNGCGYHPQVEIVACDV